MKNKPILLSDLMVLSRIITNQPCLVIIRDTENILQQNIYFTNVVIVKTETEQYFYRSDKHRFLLYINLSHESITDCSYDAIVNFYNTEVYQNYQQQQLLLLRNKLGDFEYITTNSPATAFKKQAYTTSQTSTCTIFYKEKLFIDTLVGNQAYTIAVNSNCLHQSLFVAFNEQFFLKIPLTEAAQKKVLTELLAVETLAAILPNFVHLPQATLLNNNKSVIKLSYPTTFGNDTFALTKNHIAAMLQCYTQTQFFQKQELQELPIHGVIKKRLLRIENKIKSINQWSSEKLLSQLFYLQTEVGKLSTEIYVSFAHGSFKPEHFFTKKDEIYLYNLELFNKCVPFYHDFFNVIMQQEASKEEANYSHAKQQKDAFFSQPIMIETIKKYATSIKLYYKLYILETASLFLETQLQQPEMNTKQQIDFWLAAVTDVVKSQPSEIANAGLGVQSAYY